MSFTSFSFHADGGTWVTTHVYDNQGPILAISEGGHASINVTVEQSASPEDAERFARRLVDSAQRFLDATVENNARQAVPA